MNNHTIEAIFFDFGGVLLRTFDGVDHDGIEAEFGLEPKTLRHCVYRDSRYLELHVGRCSYDEWIESARAALMKVVGDKADAIVKAYQESPRPLNPDMVALVKRLHGRYKLGIISNTIPGQEARLREQLPIVDLFDVRVGSGDVGIAKPDAGIFLHAMAAAGVAPERSVFTDDVRQFAEAARSTGMHGFHFTGYGPFVEDLRSVGVEA
jgi:HAD superfamily hydrolase (TIGR01509 family)